MKLKILHIAVHLGGGVGVVLRNWIKKDVNNEHTILLLNRNYYGEKCNNIYENMGRMHVEINQHIKDSDIVIVHFWNHPMLFDFLINFYLPASRICIWSHVSGLNPPYVHLEKLVNFSDRFLLSSIISYDSDIKNINSTLFNRVSVIWTTGGIEDFLSVKERKLVDGEFRIGYVGTLDYAKIHPSFVDLCKEIHNRISVAKFIICGSGCDEVNIVNKVKESGLSSAFNFMGYVHNIRDIMITFDVFGYPLNEKHFGTCEQVLGEVMACGIEPVVFNNSSEKYIVDSYGRICKNFEEYVDNVVNIYRKPTSSRTILQLRDRASKLYSDDIMIDAWNSVFTEMLKDSKKERRWPVVIGHVGHKIFIESLGKYGDVLKYGSNEEIKIMFDSNNQWRSKNKGSVHQYLDAFPDDQKLQEWAKL